jgi:hypothetical protein
MLTDRNAIFAETDEELLTFDVSDEALERAAPIIGGVASVANAEFWDAHRRQLRLPRLENTRQALAYV